MLQVSLTVLLSAGCIVAIVGASGIENTQTLKNVVVHINNGRKYHFIEEQEMMDLAIHNRHIDIMHMPVSRLDLSGIESVIKADPWVADAQVFVDNMRVLHMYVTQRVPVARVFQQDGHSYYLDATTASMPLSESSVYYTTVVTNVPSLGDDSAGRGMKKQIVKLARTIQVDSFWSAQVSHMGIDSMGMFELYPVLGNQVVRLGDTSRLNNKLAGVVAFYRQVLNRIGWDKYTTLDVRFSDQVVASPSLPYKGPVDKAAATMNWVNSIVETEARNDTKDSLQHAAKQEAAQSAPPEKKAAPKEEHKEKAKEADKKRKKDDKPRSKDVKKEKKEEHKPEKKEEKKHEDKKTEKKSDKPKDKDKEKKDQPTPKYIYSEH